MRGTVKGASARRAFAEAKDGSRNIHDNSAAWVAGPSRICFLQRLPSTTSRGVWQAILDPLFDRRLYDTISSNRGINHGCIGSADTLSLIHI